MTLILGCLLKEKPLSLKQDPNISPHCFPCALNICCQDALVQQSGLLATLFEGRVTYIFLVVVKQQQSVTGSLFKKSLPNPHNMFYPYNDHRNKNTFDQKNQSEQELHAIKRELQSILPLFNHSLCCWIGHLLGL